MDEPRGRSWWMIGIWVTIVVLVGVIWAVLSGMPFGGSRGPTIDRAAPPQLETIGEGSQQSATVGQIAEPGNTQPVTPPPQTATVATIPPPMTATTETTVTAAPATAPPPVAAAPSSAPPAAAPPPAHELTDGEATSRLNAFLSARRPYDVQPDCLGVRNEGYRNVGYTLAVRDLCHPDPQILGRWRVDARTGEVFRQADDGRYLRP